MKRILICVCALIAACGNPSVLVEPVPPGLLDTPFAITVGGAPLAISDVIVSTDGRRGVSLLGILQTTDGTNPTGISTGRVWLVHDNSAWIAQTSAVADPLPSGDIEKFVVGGGPAWSVGDSVDVVVEVRGGSGASQRVRGPRTVIEPADPVS